MVESLEDILIKEGLVSASQLKQAREDQKKERGGLLGALIDLGVLDEEEATRTLSRKAACVHLTHSSGKLRPLGEENLGELIPHDFARKNLVLPLARTISSVAVAVFDPTDFFLIDTLEKMTGCAIKTVVATRSDLIKAIADFYQERSI